MAGNHLVNMLKMSTHQWKTNNEMFSHLKPWEQPKYGVACLVRRYVSKHLYNMLLSSCMCNFTWSQQVWWWTFKGGVIIYTIFYHCAIIVYRYNSKRSGFGIQRRHCIHLKLLVVNNTARTSTDYKQMWLLYLIKYMHHKLLSLWRLVSKTVLLWDRPVLSPTHLVWTHSRVNELLRAGW